MGAGIARAAAREGRDRRRHRPPPGRRCRRSSRELTRSTARRQSFVQADVADVAQAAGRAWPRTVERFGRIDGLVNAAGLTTRGTLLDTTPELFDEHVAINLRAPFFLMQAAVRDMLARGAPGTIVNIITMSAHGGQPYLAPVRRREGRAGRVDQATPRTRTAGTGSGSTASTSAGPRPPAST